ncbi:ribonuclease H [Senna tora]|uniref:Ribonuclease H n=1 Tax=Senna tora TaxID=362788 RepID=A0A834SHW9_9FABA|nr:ribonuclease H [Senna tora]
MPWIIFGDFNQVSTALEKLSKCHTLKGAVQFRDLIDSSGLIDLRAQDGEWSEDYADMESMTLQYYKDVYAYPNKPHSVEIFQQLDTLDIPHLTLQEVQCLSSPITDAEIENALFLMKPDKAPGPDGVIVCKLSCGTPLIPTPEASQATSKGLVKLGRAKTGDSKSFFLIDQKLEKQQESIEIYPSSNNQ